MSRDNPLSGLSWIAAPLVAFAAVFAVLALLNRSPEPTAPAVDDGPSALSARSDTAAVIASLRDQVRANPSDVEAATALGDAYYQRLRETGAGGLAARAERAYRTALVADPGNPQALAGRATIALNGHRFADGAALARRAHAAAPGLVAVYPAYVDGLIETGRYVEAARALERMLALKPTQAGYLRLSYFRELHGDLGGAGEALRFALAAGAGSVEGAAYARTLLGDFEASRGRYAAAGRAYREALVASPGYGKAVIGLALLRAGRGEVAPAIRALRGELGNPASPDVLVELGELEQLAGRISVARRHYAQASQIEARLLRGGSGYDAGVTLNEANHGDPAMAVEYGRRAWRSAPSVSSADAYSWALYRDGQIDRAARLSTEAMRLGSRDPDFRYHAGMISADAGDDARAKLLLSALLEDTPRFSPLYAPRAERTLRGLAGGG